MGYGDIHNHNGTYCRASKRPCPFGDEGHSPSVEAYVYFKADEIGVDPSTLKKAIADGAKPAEAVKLAEEGYLKDAPRDAKSERRGGYDSSNDRFRFRRDMDGNDRQDMTAEIRSHIRGRQAKSNMAPVHIKLADRYGYGLGVPTVSYDPLTEKYSTGKHNFRVYRPELESKNLRQIIDKAAELYGYEDDEYEPVY